MTKTFAALILLACLSSSARADYNTPNLNLIVPSTGSANWAPKLNYNFDVIDSSTAARYKFNQFTSTNIFTAPVGIYGPLTVRSSATFSNTGANPSIASSSSVVVSSGGVYAPFFVGSGVGITGVSATSVAAAGVNAGTLGPAVIASSIAATGAVAGSYGDLSHVGQFTLAGDGRILSASNILIAGGGSGGGSIGFSSANFTSQCNGVTKIFNLPTSVSASSGNVNVYLDGLHQVESVDYSFTIPTTITFTTAPAANCSALEAIYSIDVSSSPQIAVLAATQTFSGVNTFTRPVTLSDGSVLTSTGQFFASGSSPTFTGSSTFTATVQMQGLLRLSSGAFAGAVLTSVDSAGNARWQSASSLTTSSSSSTLNSIPTTAFSNTTPNGCFTVGSSVTISCDGSHPVDCHGTITVSGDTNGNFAAFYILNNGQFVPGSIAPRHGQSGWETAIANRNYSIPINYTSQGSCNAGTQTFCLGALVSGGTFTVTLADVFPNNWACHEVH